MKLHLSNINYIGYILSFCTITIFFSCGMTQTFTDVDDGIYADDTELKHSTTTHNDSSDSSFSKELKRLEQLNNTDIITDIEKYKDSTNIKKETPKTRIQYNKPRYSNSDVIVNVNTYPSYGFYNDWYWDFYHGYGRNYYHPYYGYSWRNNPYYYNSGFYGYGYNSYYYNPYYMDYWYHTPHRYYNSNYYRNVTRGKNPNRGSSTVSSRRGHSSRGSSYNTRASSTYSRRSTNSNRRYNQSNYPTRTATQWQNNNYNSSRNRTYQQNTTRPTTPRTTTRPRSSTRGYSGGGSGSSRRGSSTRGGSRRR